MHGGVGDEELLRGTVDVFEDGDGSHTLVLAGEFDRPESELLGATLEELLRDAGAAVALDLRLVTFFGAAGLAALARAVATARRNGSTLSIASTSSIARLAVSTAPQLRHLLTGSMS